MNSFVTELTQQLRSFQDETTWLTPADVTEMLAQAAGRAADPELLNEIAPLTLHRAVSPEGNVYFILNCDDVTTWLTPDELSILRAILCNIDETIPAQIGDQLTEPIWLDDNTVTMLWPGPVEE